MTGSNVSELNEAELPAVTLLSKLGYLYMPREELKPKRDGERAVLLEGHLRAALLRLNPWMTGDHANRVIFNLRNSDATGILRNQAIHEYLTYGMAIDVDETTGRRSRTVQFFDFEFPSPGQGLNDFVVTTQMRVRRGNEREDAPDNDEHQVIPDIVLFVNGLPLVVIEAKAASLIGDVWKARAVKQLLRYQGSKGAPDLFDYNLMCVGICGADAVFGAIGAPEKAYARWKSTEPLTGEQVRERYGVEAKGQATLIVGLLAPATLLDILRDMVVFEPENGRLVKKLPRYQQYRAVTTAVERIRDAAKPSERGGVVWHTQGSGKSLTMLWLATKLRRERRLENPTIVTITDRTQLDRQISDTFRRCGFPSPERSRSTKELRRLLTTGAGRTIMTTIQKFEEALEGDVRTAPALNAADNVIVIVDEAHRTQYGKLAAKMRHALPQATFIGFTGTPIDKGMKRSTVQEFGPLIDKYDIKQSVADGATVPIYYEARLEELSIAGADSVDRLFDKVFANETPENRDRIRRRFATTDQIAEAPQRIQQIALDIEDHFTRSIWPNGFKAQEVASSRLAAARYKTWLANAGLGAYLIVTTTTDDDDEIKAALKDQPANADLEARFKDDADDRVQVLVVVDMLLTGFDAPVEQVMYLDRPLREHTLLQAIARVNRPASLERPGGAVSEKTYGLVVDYWGVSRHLEEALEAFEEIDRDATWSPKPDDPENTIDTYARRAESHFARVDLNDTWACVRVFEPDAGTAGTYKRDAWDRFIADFRLFGQKVDEFLPDPRALPYVDRLDRLNQIRRYVKLNLVREDDGIDWADVSAKVKALLDSRIIGEEVRPLMDKPVSILDEHFSEKIAALPHDEARASAMEHAIRAQITERLDENPGFYRKLSEQLQEIINQMRQRIIDAAEACKRLAALKDESLSLGDIAAQQGLSETSLAVYELLNRAVGSGNGSAPVGFSGVREEGASYHPTFDPELKSVSLKIEGVMRQYGEIVDWFRNDDVLRMIRRDIKRELRLAGSLSEDELNELAVQMVDVARRRAMR